MLWVKKCCNSSVCVCVGGGVFPYHSEYFPHVKNLELLFFFFENTSKVAFVDKRIRGNIA